MEGNIPTILLGIKPTTFQLVAQCLKIFAGSIPAPCHMLEISVATNK
jgi:hypothetical protein